MPYAQTAHTKPSDLCTLTSHAGHEFPFSIKMSHIRDGGSNGGGRGRGGDPTSPTDCPGVLLLDQCLPPDTQCQFILKPSKVAPGQAQLLGETGLKVPLPFHDDTLRHLRHHEILLRTKHEYFRICGWLKSGTSAVCLFKFTVSELILVLLKQSEVNLSYDWHNILRTPWENSLKFRTHIQLD